MNEQSSNKGRFPDDEKLTEQLMKIAGPRAEISAEVESRVYEQVLDAWQERQQVAPGRRIYRDVEKSWKRNLFLNRLSRWLIPAVVAASAAFVVINISEPEPALAPPVGSIVKVLGGNPDQNPAVGQRLYAGTTLTTGTGEGLSILLSGRESLRVGANSSLRVDGSKHFTLLAGQVYVDTGQLLYRDGGLRITAGFATVTDVGTQFAVEFDGAELDVAVREGRVDIGRDAGAVMAIAGERVRVSEAGAAISEELASHAPYWQWAVALAPQFDIENKTLMEFLNWAARESGMRVIFANDELRMAAMRTDIHGSVAGFKPADAVAAVLATTNFQYRIKAGAIYMDR